MRSRPVPSGGDRRGPTARSKREAAQAAGSALARKATMGWQTTDEEEVEKRLLRARSEPMQIRNLNPAEEFFSDFAVSSEAGCMPTP